MGTYRTATSSDIACIWLPNGEFIDILPTGGNPPSSLAAAVNNSNMVVGWRKVPAGTWAFVWAAGEITMIDPTLYGWNSARAASVSDSGFVVGQFGSDSGGTGRAFRWKGGAVEILQPLPGALTSNGRSVNADGTTVGNSRFLVGSSFRQHATIWGADGLPAELPVLTGYQAWAAVDVNSDGVVLGIVSAPTRPDLPSSQYVVWIEGQAYPISSLLGSGHGEVNDLNDLNQFVSDKLGGPLLFSPESELGDLNGDCVVDGADVGLLLQQWGAVADSSADLNADGKVDGSDLAIVLGAWTGTR